MSTSTKQKGRFPVLFIENKINLRFVLGTENVLDFMFYHLLDFVATYCKIRSGVEYFGLIFKNAANACGHCKTDIGVDVDLADSHACSLTEHIFGNTDSVGHISAAGVYLVNEIRDDGRSAVKNYREIGKSLGYLFENIETELRL